MAGETLEDYRLRHPGLPAELLRFFNSVQNPTRRTILDFMNNYRTPSGGLLQPHPLIEICKRLVARGFLFEESTGGPMGTGNAYLTTVTDPNLLASPDAIRLVDCVVYGLATVYHYFHQSVIPLVVQKHDELQEIGTCFVINDRTIVTAAHCLQDIVQLSIRGAPAVQLRNAQFYSHPNENLDLAIVHFSESTFEGLAFIPVSEEDPEILREILALGYPRIPTFAPSIAAEIAAISGRLTVTRGRIASTPTPIFDANELLLITARVRGGFSGGPVLDTDGQVVGIVTSEPFSGAGSEGHRYDELGYGTAVPVSALQELRQLAQHGAARNIDMRNVSFVDYQ